MKQRQASSLTALSWLFTSAILLPLALSTTTTDDQPTRCYVLDGTHNSNAGFRCNNATTGHSSCCAAGAVCYSNGLCQQANGDVQDYLRVGCTDRTWRDPACLDQCTIYANDSTAGVRFCNGALTATDQYCCDDGTHGIGSFACCQDPSNIFIINPVATLIAQIPLTYTPTTSTSILTSTATSSATTTTVSTTAEPTNSASLFPSSQPYATGGSHSSPLIIVIAVPIGVVFVLCILGFVGWRWRQSRRNRYLTHPLPTSGGAGTTTTTQYAGVHEAPSSSSGGANNPGAMQVLKGYFGGRSYEAAPQEMEQPEMVHEMPASGAAAAASPAGGFSSRYA